MIASLTAIVARDLRIAFRRWGDLASPLVFFAIVSTLFPLASSPAPQLLRTVGPAVLWIAALLSTLLSLNTLYRSDIEDGTMEQLVLSPHPLAVAMLAKTAAHWVVSGLPLIVLAPLIAVAYDLPANAFGTLCFSLALGTPALCFIGSIGAALTAGLRQASGLLALVVMPLMLPVLIFGARATDLAAAGENALGPLYLLAAILALAMTLAPLAAAAAMRISLD